MEHPELRALIFDVDGTLADTEGAHREAFNQAFAEHGLAWRWDTPLYTKLLEVSGGKERMLHYWREFRSDIGDTPVEAQAGFLQALHLRKTSHYENMVREGAVRMRPGVLSLIEAARAAGLRLAIATTTSPANISALLQAALGPGWRDRFVVIEDAATAPRKKPDPQVYRQALERLGLDARECLAFEDSANGLRAAQAAGLATIVTPNDFTAHHEFAGALRVLPSLQGVGVEELRAWHSATHPQAVRARHE